MVWIWAHPALKIALLDVVRSYADSTTAVIDTSDSPLVSRFLLIGIDSSNKLSTIITKFQKNDNLIFLAEALGAEGIRNIWTRGNALSINFRLLNDDSRTASSSDSFVSSMSNRIHWPKNAYDNNVGNLHLKDGVSPRIATVSRHLGITEASKTSENNLDCAIIIRNELGVKNEFLKVLPTYHIIVPTSYGRSFYQKLVFCGMVPIGLKELEFIKCEAGVPSYPRDFPDTLAGENFWKCDYDEQNEKTMRLPSRKKLVGRNLMESLQMMNSESIHNISWISRRLCSTSVVNHGNKTILVHVLVKSLCRGVPKSRAVLLSPTEKDMEQFRLAGNNWKGVVLEKITNSSLCENNLLFGRTVLGMLTSGFGCASGKGTSHHGIAVCSYEKIKQLAMSKQTSILLLHNERSSWLRPMLYRLI